MAPGRPIRHPAAWAAAHFAGKDTFAFDLEPRHVAALEHATARVAGRPLEDIGPEDFDLAAIADDVARLRDIVLDGRGLVLVRGFPVERLDLDAITTMYWGLGSHLGRGVSQSLMGDRLGHVLDASRGNEHARGYRSAKELDPHTDSDDVVGLLCLRPGMAGGDSLLSSALHIHNVLLAEAPEQLDVLARGFHYHWNGEEPEGEPPVTPYCVPVFSESRGLWSTVYLRHFINKAFEVAGGAAVEDKAALDAMDAVAKRADVQLRFRLEPGEAILFNNYTCLHARSAFTDDPEPGRHRHLLRLWLQARPPRPVVDAVRRYYGGDGMPFQARGAARYAGDSMGGATAAT